MKIISVFFHSWYSWWAGVEKRYNELFPEAYKWILLLELKVASEHGRQTKTTKLLNCFDFYKWVHCTWYGFCNDILIKIIHRTFVANKKWMVTIIFMTCYTITSQFKVNINLTFNPFKMCLSLDDCLCSTTHQIEFIFRKLLSKLYSFGILVAKFVIA